MTHFDIELYIFAHLTTSRNMVRWVLQATCNMLCLIAVVVGIVCTTLDPRGPDKSRRAEFWSAAKLGQPIHIKLLNKLGAWLVHRGWLSGMLAPTAALKAAAVAKTGGLNDFGDADYEEPFDVLHRSLDAEAQLTLFGRWAVEQVRCCVLHDCS